jgi:hypothetical protein
MFPLCGKICLVSKLKRSEMNCVKNRKEACARKQTRSPFVSFKVWRLLQQPRRSDFRIDDMIFLAPIILPNFFENDAIYIPWNTITYSNS